MSKHAFPLHGSYLEIYVTIDGDRRYISQTTDDVYIDAQTGAVDFTIIVFDSFEGLNDAGLVDDDGYLTGIEEYDSLDIEFWSDNVTENGPSARYHATSPEVEADLEFAIEQFPATAHVTATPRGPSNFKRVSEDDDDVTFEPEDIPDAEPY